MHGPPLNLHRLDDAPGTGLVAVRPDGYVGLRTGNADDPQVARWLSLVGATGQRASA
jgi:hypothetical protein